MSRTSALRCLKGYRREHLLHDSFPQDAKSWSSGQRFRNQESAAPRGRPSALCYQNLNPERFLYLALDSCFRLLRVNKETRRERALPGLPERRIIFSRFGQDSVLPTSKASGPATVFRHVAEGSSDLTKQRQ